MSQRASVIAFSGGLDTNSPALSMKPGSIMLAQNYEPLVEGYGRIQGYERFDGHPAPSKAIFSTIELRSMSAGIAAGDTILGTSSGTTAIALDAAQIDSGSLATYDARGRVPIINVVGTFEVNEVLYVGGVMAAEVDAAVSEFYAPTVEQSQSWKRAAQNWYRSAIHKVPGSGPIRGTAIHDGQIYAWRDNADGSAAGMWLATPDGWVEVSLGYRLNFTAGVLEFSEGDTITGAISGATATITRLVKNSGDWGSTASGYVIVAAVTGAFVAENLKVAGSTVATISAGTTPVSLPAGGRYMAISHNFYGSAETRALYFVNGVGPGMEYRPFAGAACPIETGSTVYPHRIAEISQHLLLLFPAGSGQFSCPGEPLLYDVVQGAGEFGFGTSITDVVQSNETAVAIFGENKIAMFNGTDADTFQLSELTEEAGSFAWTAQRIGKTVYVDSRGLRDLAASQNYGDFKAGTLQASFDRYMNNRLSAGVVPIATVVSKTKSQYRIYWPDGVGISVLFAKKYPEAIPFSTGDMRVSCVCSGNIGAEEYIIAGAEDGYVYRLDAGNSFDGRTFDYFLMTPYNHFGVSQEFRIHKVCLEMIAPPYTKIGLRAMFDYSDGQKELTVGNPVILYGGGGIWNASQWNEFIWSAALGGRAECYIDGIGRNVSFLIAGTSEEEQDPHILQSYIVNMTPRRFVR